MTAEQQHLAATIDHTILKPEATQDNIAKLCDEARQYLFASVCVNPTHVEFAAARLAGSPVKVCTVIGFPLGATTTLAKVYETDVAIKHGAREVDMVINIGAVKTGRFDLVERDIAAVVESAGRGNALSKVIIETSLLTDEEKIKLCAIVTNADADFIKTSTGFSTGGATVDDVKLLRANIGKSVKVKASGGIRDVQTAVAMLGAGAARLGTSSGVALVEALVNADVQPAAQGY